MPVGRKRLTDEIVLVTGEVTDVSMSASFGMGRQDRYGITPWSEIHTLDVACRLTNRPHKGAELLKVTLSRNADFDDPDYRRDLERTPLPDVGLVTKRKDMLTAYCRMPPSIFDLSRLTLMSGRSTFVLVHMTPIPRQGWWLRHIQFTTDRREID